MHPCHVLTLRNQAGGYDSNTVDLYLGGTQFESHLG